MTWLLWMLQLSSVTVELAVLMKTPPPACQTTNHVSKSEHPIGAMEEVSRKVQKANTYSITLRAHKGAMHSMSAKQAPHRGDGTRHDGVFGGVCVLPAHTQGIHT